MSIIQQDEARLARHAGLIVVVDRCPVIEWRWFGLTRHVPQSAGSGMTAPVRLAAGP